MILQTEVRGVFATNSYFYIDDETRHGFLIDPGAQADELLKIIGREKFTIEKILLTHGHFDHIGAVEEKFVCRKTGAITQKIPCGICRRISAWK